MPAAAPFQGKHRKHSGTLASQQATECWPQLCSRAERAAPSPAGTIHVADTLVSAHPNAGLPNEFGGYDLDADNMAETVAEFASAGLLNIVGGCCGTTPDHIRAIATAVADYAPRQIPEIEPACRLSGLEPFTITADSLFVNVGERCNVTGSAVFKRLILEENYDAALSSGPPASH